MNIEIRDYFAAKAMQALIPASVTEPGRVAHSSSIANLAYIFADALIEQRDKPTIDDTKPAEEDVEPKLAAKKKGKK
jgi:hypothetical protein